MVRRIAILLCTVWACVAASAAQAGPTLVFDANTGNVLHAEQALAPWFPASLTKLMTAYLVFGAIRDGRLNPGTKMICSAEAHSQPPSKLGLPIGGTISVDLALKLLIVKSANDIAVMFAEAVSGSVEDFVAEMNATALKLGMTGTHFVNPHGLPGPGQVTTARDIGLLARALLRDFPEHAGLFSLERVKVGKSTLRSHNKLLGQFAGADGMKTGYICASGYNVVASATRGERRVIAVVLGGRSGKERNDTASDLLQRGFEEAWWKSILPKKLEDLSPSQEYGLRPEHMGPVVCKQRYRNGTDAYAVDARLYARSEARTISQGDTVAASASGTIPLIAAGPKAKAPIPTLRPEP
jgi:D-alanyl-D-alanine carboxypeptidase